MRVSVGSDIVYVPRVKELLKNGRLERILTSSEVKNNSLDHLAGRIALKEAAIKALGLSAGDWLSISIRATDSGKPIIDLRSPDKELVSIDCSISHDRDYAFAVVVALYSDL